jgi:Flp pilus assembly pilin Flp
VIGFPLRNFTVEEQALEDQKLQGTEPPLLEDERGITLIEYGLVVGLIALASIVTLTSLKGNIATLMSAVGSQIMSSS